MPFRATNIDVIDSDRQRLLALKDGGARLVKRLVGTLKRRVPVFVRRDIGKQYNLPAGDIGKRLTCRGDDTSLTLTALGRPFTLAKFRPRQDRSGVAVQVERGKALHIAHAFIRVPAGAPGAGPQAMIRVDALQLDALPDKVRDGPVVDHNRHGYPLMLLLSDSVGDMVEEGDRESRLDDFVKEASDAEFDRLLEVESRA